MPDFLEGIRKEAQAVLKRTAPAVQQGLEREVRELTEKLEALRSDRQDAEKVISAIDSLDKPRRRRQQKPRVQLTEAQVRDWITNLGEVFTTSAMMEALNVSRGTASKFIKMFQEKGTITRVRTIKNTPMFEFVKPEHTGDLAPKKTSDVRVVTNGAAVPTTGKTRGTSGRPGRDRKRQRAGHRVSS